MRRPRASYHYAVRSVSLGRWTFAVSVSQAAHRCTVVRPMQKSIGKWELRPNVKLLPLKISFWNFALRDYVANFSFNQSNGASPKVGEILPFCDFLDCPVFFSGSRAQVEPLDRFSRFMAQALWLRARRYLLGVTRMGDVIWGKYAPNFPKRAKIRNFKPKRWNIKIKAKYVQTKANNCTSWVV